MQTLNGLKVMVTRPKPQGEELCEQIRGAGGQPIYFPTIAICPPEDPAAFEQGIAQLNHYDWVIFVSPQAVYQSIRSIQQAWPAFPAGVKVAAMGGGTADALRQAKLPVDAYPTDDWRSEGLLDEAAFQQLAHKKVALISGDSGRDFLAQTLTVRGAQLTQLIAYRRVLPEVDTKDTIRLLQTKGIDIIICTSGEILLNLKLLLETAWQHLCHVPVVVVSERTQMLAKQLEFQTVLLAKNASHPAIIQVLKDTVCQKK